MVFSFYLHSETNKEEFERKLLWFKSRYNLVSLNDIRKHIFGDKTLVNSCLLTVDDGWRSTYEVIYPIMKKHNVPFAIFVSPEICEKGENFWYYSLSHYSEKDVLDTLVNQGYFCTDIRKYPAEFVLKELRIGQIHNIMGMMRKFYPDVDINRGFMNTEELLELHNSGLVEIGAHTLIHPILSNESDEFSCQEIVNSVERLSGILGVQVRSFAYPNGIPNIDYGEREMEYVSSCGVDMAFSVVPGVISSGTNHLSIPRWGSTSRLKFGRLGKFLPSRHKQAKMREEIRQFKLL